MKLYQKAFSWFVLILVAVVMYGALSNMAYAMCQMTTVIDPNTGQIKMCTQCCDASGMCSVVCN